MLGQFDEIVKALAEEKGLRRAVVRSLLTCDILVLQDPSTVIVVAQRTRSGMASNDYHMVSSEGSLDVRQALDIAKWSPAAMGR